MGDEQVLNYCFQRGRKAGNFLDRARDGFQLHHDVTEELTRRGVANGALVAKLFELADVMEDRGGEQKVDIKLRIMRGDAPGHAAERNNVFKQATQISVMHYFGGWCALVAARDFRISNHAEY